MSGELLQFSDALAGIVARHAGSVVSVQAGRARVSGFAWRPGLIVTADEALGDDAADVRVGLPGGGAVPARMAGRDPTTDVALLRVDTTGPAPVQLATRRPAAGALALAVGARDDAPVAALGAVAVSGGPWRSVRGGEIDARIELDLRLRRAGEGGLAIGADGAAYGMTVLGPRRRVLVIPAATIERTAARLERDGRIVRGYLGLALQPIVAQVAARPAAMVMNVDGQGPGHAAGVRQGDVILAVDDVPVADLRTLMGGLGPDSVGRRVKLDLSRGGSALTAHLTITERPAT